MVETDFSHLCAALSGLSSVMPLGRVVGTGRGTVKVSGLSAECALGDRIIIASHSGAEIEGEVINLDHGEISVVIGASAQGIGLGDLVTPIRSGGFRPDNSWLGCVLDADGNAFDGRRGRCGLRDYPLNSGPVPASSRRGLGPRLETGLKLFNTILPIATGQRLGLFAGSGIGKSTLIGQLARDVGTDVTVIGLVGERGREVREFVEETLGPAGLAKSVVFVATSDKSPLEKRRAALAAASTAEYFRDQGKQVLLILDSITRLAEAHREIALASGESAAMRGFPPSTANLIMSLCERAGPGSGDAGDITALFSVLVAGSDMEEPIADIIRGVLDGHIVLDRKIAERGRFPAVDILRSVSRSLPNAANTDENRIIRESRRLLGAYESAELMIQSALYAPGTDAVIDAAILAWRKLEDFAAARELESTKNSFLDLAASIEPAE